MKNKLLAIAIASALSTLWSSTLLADNNQMSVTQKDSTSTVEAEQNTDADSNKTSGSSISIYQQDGDVNSSITVTQTGATDAGATIQQYKGVGSSVTINQSGGAADAGNTANVVQGATLDTDGTATIDINNGNTLTINTQAGSNNQIVGYSAADSTNDESSFATQIGTTNSATLNQDGTGNTMGFHQNGTGNSASMTQNVNSEGSTINLYQEGDANKTSATQGEGADGSTININIVGSDNNLGDDTHNINQLSASSDITVEIDGDLNRGVLSQAAGATGSNMALTQFGNDNEVLMAQNDVGNTMTVTQTNNANMAELTQNGQNDQMTVTQFGGSTATLTQN